MPGGLPVPGERVHRDDLHMVAERLGPFGEPGGERLLAPALDHVRQARRPIVFPGGEVDDDGHVPVAVAGVAPYVLVHADRVDPVEPRRIIDRRFQTFLRYGRVERVPRAGQVARARRDALRLQHDLGRGPPYRRLGQTPALRGDARQVVLPRACARQALIAAHAHQQVHGVLADRRVHEPAAPRGTHAAGRAALRAVAGRVVLGLAADQPHARARTLPLMPLPDRDQPQPVEAEQHTGIERARLITKPRGFLHFLNHTLNKTARPLHTKTGRALSTRETSPGRTGRCSFLATR